MMRRISVFSMICLIGFLGSCGGKSAPDPATEAQKPPVAPLPPKAILPPPDKPPVTPVVPPPDGLGVRIDRFNACIGAVAELIRASEAMPNPPPAQAADCGKLFDEILSTRSGVVSEPYAEYFVLAARVLGRLDPLPLVAGVPAGATPTRDFIVDYNQFALKNNELMGIPVIDAASVEPVRKSVPRRTYRDELARLGEKLGSAVRDWQFNHRFETLGSGTPAAWLSSGRVERVHFWILQLTIEEQLAAFSRFDCDKAGTGPDEKITCETLVGAGQDLTKASRAWIDAWNGLLAKLTGSVRTPSAEAMKLCDSRHGALDDKIRELPGRIE